VGLVEVELAMSTEGKEQREKKKKKKEGADRYPTSTRNLKPNVLIINFKCSPHPKEWTEIFRLDLQNKNSTLCCLQKAHCCHKDINKIRANDGEWHSRLTPLEEMAVATLKPDSGFQNK
jgi:hypothetical protein